MHQKLSFILVAMTFAQAASALGWYEIEPNQTCATGTPFSVAAGQGGGQLSSTTDIDSFQFATADTALWTITVAPVNTTYDGGAVRVRLFDPTGTLLAGRGLLSDSDPIPLRTLVSSGTYCVQIDQFPNEQIFTKEYLLSASLDNSPSALLSNEVEPNDTISTATSIAATDPPMWSQLSSSADVDYFRLESTAGDVTFLIDVENRNYDGSSLIATLSDENNILASRVVLSDQPAAIALLARRLTSGPLYLRLAQQVGYTTMDKYVTSTASLQQSSDQIEIEPNSSLQTATRIEGPGQMRGQLYDSTDTDFFRIVLPAGVSTFQVSPENSNYDGGVILVQAEDLSGNVLAAQQINSDDTGIDMNVGLAASADVVIIVSAVSGYQIFDKYYVFTLPVSAPIFANGFEE